MNSNAAANRRGGFESTLPADPSECLISQALTLTEHDEIERSGDPLRNRDASAECEIVGFGSLERVHHVAVSLYVNMRNTKQRIADAG
jgi:hypothetical protein